MLLCFLNDVMLNEDFNVVILCLFLYFKWIFLYFYMACSTFVQYMF